MTRLPDAALSTSIIASRNGGAATNVSFTGAALPSIVAAIVGGCAPTAWRASEK